MVIHGQIIWRGHAKNNMAVYTHTTLLLTSYILKWLCWFCTSEESGAWWAGCSAPLPIWAWTCGGCVGSSGAQGAGWGACKRKGHATAGMREVRTQRVAVSPLTWPPLTLTLPHPAHPCTPMNTRDSSSLLARDNSSHVPLFLLRVCFDVSLCVCIVAFTRNWSKSDQTIVPNVKQ